MSAFSARILVLSSFCLISIAACSDGTGPSRKPGQIAIVDVTTPIDLTPDGTIALLEDLGSFEGKVYFFDTRTGALTHKTDVGDPGRDVVTAISATGRVTALHADPVQAGLWSEGTGWLDLPALYPDPCSADIAGAWDVSADGHVAVGLSWDGCTAAGFLWSDATGTGVYSQLDRLGSAIDGDTVPPNNRVSVISDDGSMAAGFAQDGVVDRRPAIWRADGSGFLLNPTVPDAPGEVLSISADGHMVAGIWNQDAFYWTQASNVVNLGHLPGEVDGTPTFPNAISAGGSLIFGTSGDGFLSTQHAFYWTQARGMRPLSDLVSSFSLPMGTALTGIYAASADGTVVLGTTLDDHNAQKTFVFKAPVSVYGL